MSSWRTGEQTQTRAGRVAILDYERRLEQERYMQRQQQANRQEQLRAKEEVEQYKRRGYEKTQEQERREMIERTKLQKKIIAHMKKQKHGQQYIDAMPVLHSVDASLATLREIDETNRQQELREQWTDFAQTIGLVGIRGLQMFLQKLPGGEIVEGFARYLHRKRDDYKDDVYEFISEHFPIAARAPRKPGGRIATNLLRDLITFVTFNTKQKTRDKKGWKSFLLDVIAIAMNSESITYVLPAIQDMLLLQGGSETETSKARRENESELVSQMREQYKRFEQAMQEEEEETVFPSVKRVMKRLRTDPDEREDRNEPSVEQLNAMIKGEDDAIATFCLRQLRREDAKKQKREEELAEKIAAKQQLDAQKQKLRRRPLVSSTAFAPTGHTFSPISPAVESAKAATGTTAGHALSPPPLAPSPTESPPLGGDATPPSPLSPLFADNNNPTGMAPPPPATAATAAAPTSAPPTTTASSNGITAPKQPTTFSTLYSAKGAEAPHPPPQQTTTATKLSPSSKPKPPLGNKGVSHSSSPFVATAASTVAPTTTSSTVAPTIATTPHTTPNGTPLKRTSIEF